jgi:hypothetical protein
VALPWTTLARAGVAALVMYAIVFRMLPDRRLLTVGVRVVVGAAVYGVAIMLLDAEACQLGRGVLARLRRRPGRRS